MTEYLHILNTNTKTIQESEEIDNYFGYRCCYISMFFDILRSFISSFYFSVVNYLIFSLTRYL